MKKDLAKPDLFDVASMSTVGCLFGSVVMPS